MAAPRSLRRCRVLLWLAGLAGCTAAPARKELILTSFQPLYSWAVALAGEDQEGDHGEFEVLNLAPRSLGPHDYDPWSPEHRTRFEDAVRAATALVTLRSVSLAEHFDSLYARARAANVRIVEIDLAAPLLPDLPRLALIPEPQDGAAACAATGGASGAPNPHLWLSLSHAALMVEHLARDLGALDPSRAVAYRVRSERYRRRLLDLRAAALERLAALQWTEVAALTEGFPYLTADLGIQVVDYVIDPIAPAELEGRLRRSGARVVLAEEPPPPETEAAIGAAGAVLVVLRTLEEGYGEGSALQPDGYYLGMQENLERLVAALESVAGSLPAQQSGL